MLYYLRFVVVESNPGIALCVVLFASSLYNWIFGDHHIQLHGHVYKCRQCILHKEAHNKGTKYGKQSQRGVVVLVSSL